MTIIRPPARAGNLVTAPPVRPSAPVTIYSPGAPRSLLLLGASPAELANLDAPALAPLLRREAP